MVPDASLLRDIATGDRKALAALYDRRAPQIYGLLRRMLKDTGDADDVLQEVFFQIWRKASQFNPERGRAMTWMCVMARSRALECIRRQARIPHPVPEVPPAAGDGDPASEDPLDVAIEGDGASRLQRALDSLAPDQKRAIQSSFFLGHTHSEIAELSDLPLGTVKTRIRSGILKLRLALQNPEQQP